MSDDAVYMPNNQYCEKCNFYYDQFALTDKEGKPDERGSQCPECGHWNVVKPT